MSTIPAVPEADLLGRIPLAARSVLHAGCGRGDLLLAYRRLNPTARLFGIEPDPEAGGVALQRLDQVAIADVGADPLPLDVSGGLDCIVYNGVLDAMRDPWSLVRRHAEALTPEGVLLIAVPNAEHWRITSRLLRGAGNDPLDAPADAVPPRFTVESFARGLLEAGLMPCDVHPLVGEQDEAQHFVDAIAPALDALGVDRDAYLRRARPAQYLWRVRRTAQQRMMVAGNMLAPVGGVSHVRVVHPLQAIGTDPLVSVQVTDRIDTNPPKDALPRIFVLHRPSLAGQQGRALLNTLMDAGWLVVTEFDDHPDFFPGMKNEEQLPFRGVHAIQTSTKPLADVFRERNPEVAVFPNALVSLPDVRNFGDPRSVTLFFGALNREQDWRPYIDGINKVAARVGARLRFQVVHDQEFFAALTSPHKRFTPICDYETYMRLLGGSEISFMPLADNAFNRAKSDLKYIEAASCRVASLASTVVYADSIEDGRTGLLFRDPVEMQERLLRLVAVPGLARGLGDAARRYVRDHRMLAYQVAPRIAWYRSLWARRHELTAATRRRMDAVVKPAA